MRFAVKKKMIDPWKKLGEDWKKALADPYYILSWQVLAVTFQAII